MKLKENINIVPIISQDPIEIEGSHINFIISNEIEYYSPDKISFYLALFINGNLSEDSNLYIFMNSTDRIESKILLGGFEFQKEEDSRNYLATWEIELDEEDIGQKILGHYEISIHLIPVKLDGEYLFHNSESKVLDDELSFKISSGNYRKATIYFHIDRKFKLKVL